MHPDVLLLRRSQHVAMPCGDGSPEELTKDVKLEVSGVLGLNGASVDLYSYSNEQGTKISLPSLTTTTITTRPTTSTTIIIIIITIIIIIIITIIIKVSAVYYERNL